MSAFGAERDLLEGTGMKQNVINAILFFSNQTDNDIRGVDMRKDLIKMMRQLAHKYERMSCIPRFEIVAKKVEKQCIWFPIQDLDAAVERAVLVDSSFNNGQVNEAVVLTRAHTYVCELLTGQDEQGRDMPLWRAILLSPNAVLIRIDHCICDGLSAVTLLKDIGCKRRQKTSSFLPLTLGDLSPILRAIEVAGDFRIFTLPLKLLWLPNLVRAVSLTATCLTFPEEQPNPMRPHPGHIGKVIPREHYGTIFFPTMKVTLFREMARGAGKGTTINDILLLCLSIAVGSYFDELKVDSDIGNIHLVLPIANPLCPSTYGDKVNGLCNRMTPVIFPLNLPRRTETSKESEQELCHYSEMLLTIKAFMTRVKKSNATLFLTCMNTILSPLLSLEKVAKEGGKMFKKNASIVYSNVPGPVEEICLCPSRPGPSADNFETARHYTIQKIQTLMPHPVSIFQVLSYNGNMFFNILLDTRSAEKPWLLRTEFVRAVREVADWTGASKSDEWKHLLDSYETSNEWGGKNVVYRCG